MANPALTTAPAHLPITVAEAKRHLKIEQDDQTYDGELWPYMQAATEAAEVETGRGLVTQTRTAYFDSFPTKDYLELWGGRLQSITSLVYTDSDDSDTTWAASNYIAVTTNEPGRLHLAYGISWPSVTLKPRDAIAVQYVCGYGTGDQVPSMIRAAILLTLGNLWENREDQIVAQGLTPVQLPIGVKALLLPYKLHVF